MCRPSLLPPSILNSKIISLTKWTTLTWLSYQPRSNKHGRKRLHTRKYDDLHVIVLRSYISVSYTDENAIVYGFSKRRLYTISVLLRFSPYTDQYDRKRLRRYTIVILSQVLLQNIVVNDRIFSVYDCIRPFTEFVTFDLGIWFWVGWSKR
jgi:hypothetical protein